nr:type II toxin-antitoxin system RelE/ParE family toxin [Saccharomonospora sp. CUA-673]
MIRSFADKRTEQVWNRQRVRGLPPEVQRVGHRKLRQLDVVDRLIELRVPPGNQLEQLKGDRAGMYSIRIDRQWRICFRWTYDGPEGVEIVDYHR